MINVVAFVLSGFSLLLFFGIGPTSSSESSLSFWEVSFTPVRESCNKHVTKYIRFVTLSTEWVTRGFCLNVRRRLYCVRHVRARRHPAIISQRTRASSVGKTPSFSFCQVDMYAYTNWRSFKYVRQQHLTQDHERTISEASREDMGMDKPWWTH